VHIKDMLPFLPDYLRFQWHGNGQAWHILTHMTKQEKLMLYSLARKQLPDSVLLEIGSYLGASSCFLAAAALEIRGGGVTVHCVDTWQNEGMSEGKRDTWSEFQNNTTRYQSVIVPHRGRSVDTAMNFNHQIDLLFIDGDHSYEGCRIDVESWLSHVKSGGLIIMHDYGWAEGVRKVVREFISPRAVKERTLPNLYWAWIK
jgi:predicted O-methyltransferase YrrM